MAAYNFENEQVIQALGVNDMNSAMEIMNEMNTEFVTEQPQEGKLNKEIDDLLKGIDFQDSWTQDDPSSATPICITSSPEEDNVETSTVSPTCIPSSLPEENNVAIQISSPELFPMETEITSNGVLPMEQEIISNLFHNDDDDDEMSPSEVFFIQEDSVQPQILPMEQEPILHPFTCSEEKTPEKISLNAVSINDVYKFV